VFEADITACFDEIEHAALLARLRRRVKDKRILNLVGAFLRAGILSEEGLNWETITGTPQGGILSPLLANIALSVLDEHFAARWHALGPGWKRAKHRRQGGAVHRLAPPRRRCLPSWTRCDGSRDERSIEGLLTCCADSTRCCGAGVPTSVTGVSSRTFGYVDHFAFWRIVGWIRKRHLRLNWGTIRRRYLPAWEIGDGTARLYRPRAVAIVRYRYRGARIKTPWASTV